MRVGIALGSNLGDRMANLRDARKAVSNLAGDKTSLLASRVYETEPIDCEPGAGRFLNAVLEIDYEGNPTELLVKLAQIEESLGRERDHARNVSRKIDIDILYADDLVISNGRLQLPHPRMHQRNFVLQPLADIRRDLILPGRKESVSDLLAQLQDSAKVKSFTQNW